MVQAPRRRQEPATASPAFVVPEFARIGRRF